MCERETSKVISSGASDGVLYAIGLLALFGQVAINAIDHGGFGFPKRGWLVGVVLGLMPLIGMMWVPLVRRARRWAGQLGLLRGGRGAGRGDVGVRVLRGVVGVLVVRAGVEGAGDALARRMKAGGRVGGRPEWKETCIPTRLFSGA